MNGLKSFIVKSKGNWVGMTGKFVKTVPFYAIGILCCVLILWYCYTVSNPFLLNRVGWLVCVAFALGFDPGSTYAVGCLLYTSPSPRD